METMSTSGFLTVVMTQAASHADRRDASRLQAHAKHLQELSKLDYQDVKDSSALEALESVQHE